MSEPFDYFVVFAEMRTGSNFLESNLNAFEDVTCFGEAFNPHFIGYPNKESLLGVTQEMREEDPLALINRIKSEPGRLGGFRFFHNHDPRVLQVMLEDPRCAKIILTRNPLDSYVSWKIAKATGQWKLTNVNRRKAALAHFDKEEFARHVEALQDFQVTLLNALQTSGQTGFYIAYEDLQNLDVINGLGRWLGASKPLQALDDSLKRQNPAPVVSKVENPKVMEEALAGMDRFNLSRTPNFEPRRGPAVPAYTAGVVTPLLYLPIRGGPVEEVVHWMAALDHVSPDGLINGMNQKQLRQWKKGNPGFRSFTVLRHPAPRAHSVFCRRILGTGKQSYGAIRETLRRQFKLPLPPAGEAGSYDRETHRIAFGMFLDFLQSNLAGQTAVRVDAEWASQSQILNGFAELAPPDLVLREEEIYAALPDLARKQGRNEPGVPSAPSQDGPFPLHEIWDAELEKQVSALYQRDYVSFGFAPWKG